MNAVPVQTKVSAVPNQFETQADFGMINSLLRENPLYQVPERLRQKTMRCIEGALDDPGVNTITKIAATRVVLEMDKRNIEVAKLVIPRKVEHVNVKNASDEELISLAKKVLPPNILAEGEKGLEEKIINGTPKK